MRFEVERAWSEAWRLLRAAPVAVVVGVVLSWFQMPGGGGVVGSDDPWTWFDADAPAATVLRLFAVSITGLVVMLLVMLFGVAIRSFGRVGWTRWAVLGVRGHIAPIELVLSGRDRFLDMFGWRLLRLVIVYVPTLVVGAAVVGGVGVVALRGTTEAFLEGLLALGIGLVVSLVLAVVLHAKTLAGDVFVVMEGADPWTALTRSWAVTHIDSGALAFALVQLFVAIPVLLAGLMTCGIAWLVVLPWYFAAHDLGAIVAWVDAHPRPA